MFLHTRLIGHFVDCGGSVVYFEFDVCFAMWACMAHSRAFERPAPNWVAGARMDFPGCRIFALLWNLQIGQKVASQKKECPRRPVQISPGGLAFPPGEGNRFLHGSARSRKKVRLFRKQTHPASLPRILGKTESRRQILFYNFRITYIPPPRFRFYAIFSITHPAPVNVTPLMPSFSAALAFASTSSKNMHSSGVRLCFSNKWR